MKVFISYAEPEGLPLAYDASAIFEAHGHSAWMWKHSRSPGARTWAEIAERILGADRFLCIWTGSSQTSFGQGEEVNIALNQKIEPLPVCVNGAPCPPALSGRNCERVSTADFPGCCERLAAGLRDLEDDVAGAREVEPASSATEKRAKYVADLRGRTDRLDRERVEECRDEVLRSYESASTPRQISRVSQVFDHTPTDFRHIGFWLRGNLDKFNAPNYWWGHFCSQLGRGVALGEEHYLHQCLAKEIDAGSTTISQSEPDFAILIDEIRSLRGTGQSPDTLLAPIEVMVPFYAHFQSNLDWTSQPGETLTLPPDISLRVFWFNAASPLNRFVIFNSRAAVWSVKPDRETGHALTVAIGQSALYSDQVEWVAETVAKYEVTNPKAFRSIMVERQAIRRAEEAGCHA
jgi:hypothetical protein